MARGEIAPKSRKKPVEPAGWTVERVAIWISIVFCTFTVLYYSYRVPALGVMFTGITVFGFLPMAPGDRIRKKN